MKEKISNRRNWWLVSVCEQNEVVGTDKQNPRRLAATWVNSLLINAPTLDDAYDKALRLSRIGGGRYRAVGGKTAYWKVVGVVDLVPVYDDIEDGTEIMWTDRGAMTVGKAKKEVLTKSDLKRYHRIWLQEGSKEKTRQRPSGGTERANARSCASIVRGDKNR